MATQQRNDGPSDLPVYLSPYEYWNFGAGRGYALPAMRDNSLYISAFAEFASPISSPGQAIKPIKTQGHLPTLWAGCKPRFLPFVIDKPFDYELDSPEKLRALLGGGLENLNLGERPAVDFLNIKSARFRVALPVPCKAMHPKMTAPDDPMPAPDEALSARIKGKRLTIIAVIDDGIPFAHRNFRSADGCGTRFEFCWLQSAHIDPQQTSVLFGREYTRADIDGLIARSGHDEDRLYHEAGATTDANDFGSLLEHHTTHGAHVMNLAAGYDPAHGEEPPEEIRIIAVQLPNSVTMDTSGFGKDMYILAAFHYIFNRADIIRKMYGVPDPRLVINFSYGYTGGRHDGKTELEAAISELIQTRRCIAPTALVLASGNTFLDRLHAEIHDEDFHFSNAIALPWRIQPNDRTPSYLELWFWGEFTPADPFDFTIDLRNPGGDIVHLRDHEGRCHTSLQVGADDQNRRSGDPIRVFMALNAQGQVFGQLSADWHRADAKDGKSKAETEGDQDKTGRWRVLIVIAPTEPEDDCLPGADAGKWTVEIRRRFEPGVVDYPIHCWIQRATDFESFRSGSRQSYFDDNAYEEARFVPQGDLYEKDCNDAPFKTLVKRFGSLNGLATGKTSLIVAGYRLGAGLRSSLACARPARYSAAGTLKPDGIDKAVDCSSMSDRSRALPGTISTGVRSGSRSFVQGTSAAAPFVARRLAEAFAEEESVLATPHDNYLSLLCGYRPATQKKTSPPSDNDSGCGKDDPELIKARLGAVLVPPHWQPGIKDRVYPEAKPAAASTGPD